jgi:hypothetical protein
MNDWQIAVLNSENLRVDQDQYTGYRLVIRRTDRDHGMRIENIIATIKASKRKPVIMNPDEPGKGMFAERKEVLEILTARSDYQEFRLWMAEAKMNGVI